MLGLAHTLIATERADLEFFARYCTGYEAWRAYLLGETDGIVKDAAWAARICDVDASVIRGLCQRMTAQRTMLSMSWSIQRADHGEQPCWHSRRSTASPSGALNENDSSAGPLLRCGISAWPMTASGQTRSWR